MDVNWLQPEITGAKCCVPDSQVWTFIKGEGGMRDLYHAQRKEGQQQHRRSITEPLATRYTASQHGSNPPGGR